MYAVIKTGGKQHKVKPGDIIEVEHLQPDEDTVTFHPVLVVDDDGTTHFGKEAQRATVTAKLVGEQTEILVMAGSSALRQGSHALDRAEDPFAGVFLQRLSEQLAEQPHVLPQRPVRICIHGSTISQGRTHLRQICRRRGRAAVRSYSPRSV